MSNRLSTAEKWAERTIQLPYYSKRYSKDQLIQQYMSLNFTSNDLFRYVFMNNDWLRLQLVRILTGLNITETTICNCEPALSEHARKIRFDLRCTFIDENGKKALLGLEITNYGTGEINLNRSVNYTARLALDDEPVGGNMKDYENLQNVWQITLCGKMTNLRPAKLIHRIQMSDIDDPQNPLDRINLIIVEMDYSDLSFKQGKPLAEWQDAEKLIYYLKHSNEDDNAVIRELRKEELFRKMEEEKENYMGTLEEDLYRMGQNWDWYDRQKELQDWEYLRQKHREEEQQFIERNEKLSEKNEHLREENVQLSEEKEQLSVEKEQLSVEKEQLSVEKEQLSVEKEQLFEENRIISERNQFQEKQIALLEQKLRVYRLAAEGLSQTEIAEKTGLSTEMIRTYLTEA